MKKILRTLFVLSLVMSLAGTAHAQKYGFGAKVATAVEWYSMEDTSAFLDYDAKANFSYAFGPSAKFYFGRNSNFNFDVSILFLGKSLKLNQTGFVMRGTPVDRTEHIRMNYVYFPLNMNGQFTLVGDLQGVISFGAIAAVKTGSKRKITDNLVDKDLTADFAKVKNISLFNVYLTTGLGLDYGISDDLHLTGLIQYNHGILDCWLDKNGSIAPSVVDNLVLKNRNVSLAIGVYINF